MVNPENIPESEILMKIFQILEKFEITKITENHKNLADHEKINQIIYHLNHIHEKLDNSLKPGDILKQIMKTMPDGLIITNPKLLIQEINPAMEFLLGYDAQTLPGKSIEYIYSGEMYLLEHLLIEPPEKGYFGAMDTTCVSVRNEKIPVSTSMAAVHDCNDQIQNFVFLNRDISGIKRKETEVFLLNQKMTTMLKAFPDLMFEVDRSGKLFNYHCPRREFLLLPSVNLTEKNISEVLPEEIVKCIMVSLGEAEHKGWSGENPFEISLPSGKFWAEISINRMGVTDGENTHFIIILRDVTERKKNEFDLRQNMDLLNEAQRMGHLGSWELNVEKNELIWSDEIYRIFELDKNKFQPSYENFLNTIHPDDREKVNQAYSNSLKTRQPYDIIHRLQFPDNRIKWVHEHCTNFFNDQGLPIRSVGAVQDITEQMLIEEELRLAAVTFETHDGILITDSDGKIIRVNQSFQNITGYTADEVLGKNPSMMSSGKHSREFYEDMWSQLNSAGSWSGEIWDKRKNGKIYPKWLTITAVKDKDQKISRYIGIFSDLSLRKKIEKEIENLVFFDVLTNMPNRRLFLDRFRSALSLSARNRQYGAVLYLDMDRFKNLNDIMGHDYGDMFLVEVSQRIKMSLGESDTASRFGGDEFVILIEEIDSDEKRALQKTAIFAEMIRKKLGEPYKLQDREYFSSPSIGVCLYRGNEKSVMDLLKSADMAMYQAKESGRNTVRFFDPQMQKIMENHSVMEANLRNAITGRQLNLFYQVQVDNNFCPIGAEALLRWHDPKQGFISPAEFIPIAEESTLILDIGNWVMDTAFLQLAKWKQSNKFHKLALSINVSARQFGLAHFVDIIREAILKYNIDPNLLKLELTEHVLLDRVTDVVAKMNALKKLGVSLSIDDFGTGYSSLSYLKQLPINQLKIDQSFVRDIAHNPDDAMMVKTIISLAENFHLNVIAEGVENEPQMNFLEKNGCMAYQGYFFGKPVSIDDFEKSLNNFKVQSVFLKNQ